MINFTFGFLAGALVTTILYSIVDFLVDFWRINKMIKPSDVSKLKTCSHLQDINTSGWNSSNMTRAEDEFPDLFELRPKKQEQNK